MAKARGTREEYLEDARRNEERLKAPRLSKAQLFKLYNEIGDAYYAAGEDRGAYRAYTKAFRYVVEADKKRLYLKREKIKPLKKGRKEKKNLGRLVRKFSPVFAIVSFVIALFFISFSLTGYAVVGLTQENSRFISTILFIFGLVFAFFYFKNKK